MTQGILSLFCLLSFGVAQMAPDVKAGTISGHVAYKDGSPVKDAEVEVHFFAALGAILPPPARTDDKGYFKLSLPPLGEGVVSASKVSEGYPNAAIALYGRKGFGRLRRIDVRTGVSIDEINLRFGEPDAVIEWTVQSAVTHQLLKTARYSISWPDDPNIFSSSTIYENGSFLFVLPRHPVTVKITAPGFADWSYSDEQTGKQTLLLKPGTHEKRVIFLKPLQ